MWRKYKLNPHFTSSYNEIIVHVANMFHLYFQAKLAYSGGTSNLRSHLRSRHPSAGESCSSPGRPQPLISDVMGTPKKKLTPSEHERITQKIANMVVKDYTPLNVVCSSGFKELMDTIVPAYSLPCRNTIRARIMSRYQNEKDQLTSDLAKATAVSLTTDTWTSNSTESYITVTEHYVDNEWRMHSGVLMTRAMPEKHTGDNLADKLIECVEEFGISDKVECCVHDNAANMNCAGRKCPWADVGCFAHTLQLCIKPGLEINSVSKMVSRARKLVGHFKHSTTLTAEMEKRQEKLEVKQHKLISDVTTRWNSTYLMLDRLCEQRRVINDVMLDTTFTSKDHAALNLENSEWVLAKELCVVLKDFTDTTAFMSTESHVSLSEVYPIVIGLMNGLKYKSSDHSVIVKVKKAIRSDMNSRFEPETITAAKSLPMLACLLDPQYKRLPFLTADQRQATHEILEERLDDVPLSVPARNDDAPPTKRRRLNFCNFDDDDEDERSDELASYIAEKPTKDCDPLDWWKRNETRYPQIAVIAKRVLGVPATSVSSERIFSAAGLLINKLRNRLSSDIVDSIIFLNKNKVPNDIVSDDDDANVIEV